MPEKYKYFTYSNIFDFVHAQRSPSRNFLHLAETLQKNLGHCHIEWHSNRVLRIGWKGSVFGSVCLDVFVRLAEMSGPSFVIHMAGLSGCLTPGLDCYYVRIVLEKIKLRVSLSPNVCLYTFNH